MALDPDSGVRAAVTRLFTTFDATGSASGVVKAFAADKLTFPARDHTGPRAGDLYWKPLRLDQVLDILHNPRYAGAYCYGRRTHRSGDGKTSTTIKPREQWTTLIPGAHDGYITWAQFEANQQQLAANLDGLNSPPLLFRDGQLVARDRAQEGWHQEIFHDWEHSVFLSEFI